MKEYVKQTRSKAYVTDINTIVNMGHGTYVIVILCDLEIKLNFHEPRFSNG